MFFLIKFFLTIMMLFFLLSFFSGLSLVLKFRNQFRESFMQGTREAPPPPPPGKGDIIEGEYQVLDEKGK